MYNVRLLFLPGSASALVAVFFAGLTFGFKHFPFVICFYFSLVYSFYFLLLLLVLIIFYYFLVIFIDFLLFSCFGPLSRSLWVSAALLDDCPGLWSCLSVTLASHLPFASSTCFFCFYGLPSPSFCIFPCFSILGRACDLSHARFFFLIFYLKLFFSMSLKLF